jgi:hypothetical protein
MVYETYTVDYNIELLLSVFFFQIYLLILFLNIMVVENLIL